MIIKTTYDLDGLILKCEADYQPEEKQTMFYPGCGASVEYISAEVNGVDIFEHLNSNIQERIEEMLLCYLAERDAEAKEAAAEARYDYLRENARDMTELMHSIKVRSS